MEFLLVLVAIVIFTLRFLFGPFLDTRRKELTKSAPVITQDAELTKSFSDGWKVVMTSATSRIRK